MMSEVVACALWVLFLLVGTLLACSFGHLMEYLTEEVDFRRLLYLVHCQFYPDEE